MNNISIRVHFWPDIKHKTFLTYINKSLSYTMNCFSYVIDTKESIIDIIRHPTSEQYGQFALSTFAFTEKSTLRQNLWT